MNQRKFVGKCVGLAFVVAAVFATSSGAQLIVGGPTADGSLKVREAADADEVVFEAAPGVVRIGTSGAVTSDVDFRIADVFGGDFAVSTNSSQSNVNISSATNTNDGDLSIYDGLGLRTFNFSGSNANTTLGGIGEDGNLNVVDVAGVITFQVNGDGDVTQPFGNEGLVKAWCHVDQAGNFVAGFRCTNDANFPTRSSTGVYRVDFTALSTNLDARPYVVSCSSPSTQVANCGPILAQVLPSDLSVVSVGTRNALTSNPVDAPFTIVFF